MNVSELTDVELNRAMIWLYPLWGSIWMVDQTGDQMIERKGWSTRVDYLTDWNLTMPLAVEHKIMLDFEPDTEYDEVTVYNVICSIYSQNKNPLRAICEVLVMIKVEGK
tara:strand:+ start:207 stop:533 length:327 start_codon:yes stop_codon:yes gene_type:complete